MSSNGGNFIGTCWTYHRICLRIRISFCLECSSYNVQIHGSVEFQTYFQEVDTTTSSVFASTNKMYFRRWDWLLFRLTLCACFFHGILHFWIPSLQPLNPINIQLKTHFIEIEILRNNFIKTCRHALNLQLWIMLYYNK